MEDMTEDAFMDLLTEAFFEDVTQTRILFVFFFCSDIAIRALRQRLHDMFSRIFNWSMQFIANNLSRWVQRNGGWVSATY